MKTKKRSKKLMIALFVLLGVILLAVVFFSIPYSPLKSAFKADTERLAEMYAAPSGAVFTEDDISGLPAPVRKYFRYCGFIGAPKMSGMKAVFRNVPFKQGKTGPDLKITYTQVNYVALPQRLAFIKSSLFGIPFDGYDSFIDGKGGMHGVVAKLITIFNQKGADMDKASLVTFLSESLLVPSAALQDYVTWTAVDGTHAEASISCYGITARGIFTFNETGEMLSFSTNDRAMTDGSGHVEYARWTVVLGHYERQNGFMVPTASKAVWNLPEGDFVYFDSDNITIEFF